MVSGLRRALPAWIDIDPTHFEVRSKLPRRRSNLPSDDSRLPRVHFRPGDMSPPPSGDHSVRYPSGPDMSFLEPGGPGLRIKKPGDAVFAGYL